MFVPSRSPQDVMLAELPTQAAPHRYAILSPKVGVRIATVILSNRPTGVYCHFADRRTTPCMGSVHKCEGCFHGWKPVWKGFLAVHVIGQGRRHLLQLTTECVRHDKWLSDPSFDLRGLQIQLERMGKANNSLVKATWPAGDRRTPEDQIPAAFSVRDALLVLWGLAPNTGARVEVEGGA